MTLAVLFSGGVLSELKAQSVLSRADNRPTATAERYRHQIQPLLSEFCFGCHGGGKHKGDIALDSWRDGIEAARDVATWQRVLKMLEDREMPPRNKLQPSDLQRQQLTGWIETDVFHCDCQHPDPGRAPIRRLNRAEYNNTMRDLLGVDFKPADDFPVDDSGYGFDNMADALSLSPLLLEKYLAAAEKCVNAALQLDPPAPPVTRRFSVDALEVGYNARQRGDGWVFLNSIEEDDVAVDFDAASGGDFAVRVRAYALQESSNAVKLTFVLGPAPLQTFEVETNAASPRVYEGRLKLEPGRNRVRAVVRRVKDGLSETEARRWKSGTNQKGAVFVQWLELQGPLASATPSATHQQLFGSDGRGESRPDRARARKILGQLAPRAYRRAVSRDELEPLVKIAAASWERGETFEQGVGRAIEAMLVSPHFLFRSTPRADTASSRRKGGVLSGEMPGGVASVEVDEMTLASRLSYFLWSTMPDEQLSALARRGQLRRRFEDEVGRMLADGKARALVDNFAGQWLQLRNLELFAPDKQQFPKFNEDLRAAMRQETERLFQELMQKNRSILDFLDGDYTFVNETLAKHYGLPGVKGAEFQRVSLLGTARRGVLSQASILALTSNPTRTSPVKRGKWVLETLLNAPPPPPPPDVPELKESKELRGTLRQRMEQHRADPLCASCHARMDPIGFALENFDAIGAWRELDGSERIDATGTLSGGERFQGATELAQLLSTQKRESFVRCFAEKLLTYALGRGVEFGDRCALDEIVKTSAKHDYRFQAVVLGIVRSVPFQRVRRSEVE